jgi:hypothetical protein
MRKLECKAVKFKEFLEVGDFIGNMKRIQGVTVATNMK